MHETVDVNVPCHDSNHCQLFDDKRIWHVSIATELAYLKNRLSSDQPRLPNTRSDGVAHQIKDQTAHGFQRDCRRAIGQIAHAQRPRQHWFDNLLPACRASDEHLVETSRARSERQVGHAKLWLPSLARLLLFLVDNREYLPNISFAWQLTECDQTVITLS